MFPPKHLRACMESIFAETTFGWLFALGFVLGASIIWAAAASASHSDATTTTAGEWQFTEINGAAKHKVCVENPIALSSALRSEKGCVRLVLQNQHDMVVTHFICRAGSIRHVIRVIASESVLLETQGFLHGAPFGVDYNGRRVGSCRSPNE